MIHVREFGVVFAGGVSLPVAGEVTALASEIWWCESLGVLVYRKDSPEDCTATQASWAFILALGLSVADEYDMLHAVGELNPHRESCIGR